MPKKSVLAMYYAQANDITTAEANTPVHQKRMMRALVEICGYEGLYEGETVAQQDVRLGMVGKAASGENVTIAAYFKNLYPDLYKGKQDWEVIYQMQNIFDSYKKTAPVKNNVVSQTSVNEENEVVQATKEEKESGMKEVKASSDKKLLNKEDMSMSEKFDAGKAIEEGADEVEKMLNQGASMATEDVDAATAKAIDEAIESDMSVRVANTQNWTVANLIYLKKGPKDLYVHESDGKVYGRVRNPEKVLEEFKKKVGAQGDGNGQYTFAGIMPGDGVALNTANEIIKQLEEAIKNPDKLFVAYESKSKPALKGIKLQKSDTAVDVLDKEQAITTMMDSTLSKVFLRGKTAQLEVKLVSSRNKPGKSVATTTTAKKSAAQLRVVAADEALVTSLAMYIRDVDTSDFEERRGGRSELAVKYMKGEFVQDGSWKTEMKKDDPTKMKIQTYHIPLDVKQYKFKDDPDLIAKFPIKNAGEIMSVTPEGVEKLTKEFKSILGSAVSAAFMKKTKIAEEIKKKKADIENAAGKKASDDLNALE